MAAKRVTIKDIASEMGIDYSTVAYALSGKGSIKEETRLRVKKVAEKMGYIRNRLASDMRKNSNSTIGLVVPSIVSKYGEFAQHVFRMSYDLGFNLQIAVSEFDAKLETDSVQNFLEGGVGGILLTTNYTAWSRVPKKHPLRTAEKNGIPVVHYGSKFKGSPFKAAHSNNLLKSQMIGKALKDNGCRKACFLLHQGPPLNQGFINFADNIAEALGVSEGCDAVSIVNLKEKLPSHIPESKVAVNVHYREEVNEFMEHGGIWAAEQLLESALKIKNVDALICQNDLLAVGVIIKCKEKGIRVPEDMAVIACDRSFAAAYSPVPLVSVHIPQYEIARAAISLLEKKMRGDDISNIRIEPVLTAGESLKRK